MESSKICAELFLTKNNKFHLFCKFCENIYQNFQIFTKHFFEDHLNNFNCAADLFNEFIGTASTIVTLDPIYVKEEGDQNCKTKLLNVDENQGPMLDSYVVFTDDKSTFAKSHQCKICLRNFERKNSLTMHAKFCGKPPILQIGNDEIEPTKALFQCELCKRIFTKQFGLSNHLNACGRPKKKKILIDGNFLPNDTDLTCNLCFQIFENKSGLGGHLRFCGKTIIEETILKTKQKIKENKSNKLGSQCDIILKSGELHNEIRKAGNENNLTCEKCSKTFKCYAGWKSHIKFSSHTKTKQNWALKKKIKKKKECSKCQKCSKIFTNEINDKKHLDGCRNNSRDGEVLENTETKLNNNTCQCNISSHVCKRSKEKKLHKIRQICENCGKDFANKERLFEHIRSNHTGERPYQCRFCPKTFASYTNFRSHDRTHLGLKPYKCEFCDKTFGSKSNKTIHIARHHNNPDTIPQTYQYHCNFCSINFVTECDLSLHLEKHKTNSITEKSYKCNYCPLIYSSKIYLNNHIKLCHPTEYNYRCAFCGKGFLESYKKRLHEQMHTRTENNFQCDLCDKRYARNDGLTKHKKKTHQAGNIFSCIRCDEKFNVHSLYVEHCKAHDEKERLFPCSFCGIRWGSQIRLNKHLRVKHNLSNKNSMKPNKGDIYQITDAN